MPPFPLAFGLFCGALPWLPVAHGTAKCDSSQYQASALVLNCDGAVGTMTLGLKKAQALSIGTFPAGTRDVEIALSANVDFDMQLIDSELGKCIVGFNCEHHMKCADEADFCISYEKMPVYFSGDDEQAPVQEKIKIKGVLTRPMDIAVFAQAVGTGHATYSYSTLSPCPAVLPGCAACEDYMACLHGVPQCDGTPSVTCAAKTALSALSVIVADSQNGLVTAAPTTTAAPAAATPSVGSAIVAHPAEVLVPTNRPSFKKGFKEIVRNVTSGVAEVGGLIREGLDETGEKIKYRFDNTVEKIDQRVKNTVVKIDQKVDKVRQNWDNGVDKVNNTFQKIKSQIEANLPTFKPAQFVGKEQTENGAPTSRSQQQVPPLGAWLVSLFQPWSSPGALCAMGLLATIFMLFSATSHRFCTLVRVRSYAHVRPPVARTCQSREVFSVRVEDELDPEAGEAKCEGPSCAHLLEEEDWNVD